LPVGNPLIVALDTADLERLKWLAAVVGPRVGLLKVGLEAFVAHGPAAVRAAAAHAPVFLDLKLHDIPNTVAGAATAAARLRVAMLTVHASGGEAMLRAAVEAAPDVRILAVTVLTSLSDADLAAVGEPLPAQQVPRLAALAVAAGAGGLVCAPPDVPALRAAVGQRPVIVTPGVRPAGVTADDQARVATPRAALDAGADYLVVGRPITAAPDPAAAAGALLHEVRA
jgi:orotidine-5'-phosphate decarboxylase